MGQRGQKKQYIQKITSKDEKMLKAFRCCGYLTKDMLKEKLAMSDHRIENFKRDKYIEKIAYADKTQNQVIETYRLTNAGKDFLEKQLGLSNCYRSTSISHDIEVAQKYMNCSETERESWKTESKLREQFDEISDALLAENRFEEYDRLQEYLQENDVSAIDGSYISDETGLEMSAEVVTDSYGRAEIEAKITFCHIMNIHQN
ncbi:hypothetical protein [Desulfosporosinus metallidurans]|uniref:Uncharacterized protein n=1 Tax=Desulfosporosinus metallidurans TaxID=1888891 RepID=A0A1Q8R2P3_9FIRM|nr:hypothetical protein [Desulfosporosinus metallidurans]OLN33828.1 hypothetical protein DSOL_0006 [Desulfosporosinus metallidurans]